MGVQIDSSELTALAIDFRRAGPAAGREAGRVIAKGAGVIKKRLVAEMLRSRHFRQVARTIRYDVHRAPGVVEAVIGPDMGQVVASTARAGSRGRRARLRGPGPGTPAPLAHIAYYGTSRGGGSVPAPYLALHDEAEQIEQRLSRLLAEVTR